MKSTCCGKREKNKVKMGKISPHPSKKAEGGIGEPWGWASWRVETDEENSTKPQFGVGLRNNPPFMTEGGPWTWP